MGASSRDTHQNVHPFHLLFYHYDGSPRRRIIELHRALRRNGLEVTKAQKGELRIAEDQAIEYKRRVQLQVGVH